MPRTSSSTFFSARTAPHVRDQRRGTRILRRVGVVALAVELAWAVAIIIGASDGAFSILDLIGYVHGGGLFGVLGTAACLFALVLWWRGRVAWRRVIHAVVLQGLVLGTVFCAVHFDLAFRLRFSLSRSRLVAYADEVRSGARTPATPEWIGLFRVLEVDHPADSVRFITGSCLTDDCGIAHSPGTTPPRIGEDSYETLVDDWYWWRRSW